MNLRLLSLEIGVVAVGLALLLADLCAPNRLRRLLGWAAALAVLGILAISFAYPGARSGIAFDGMYVYDPFALFFKRFFLVAAALILIMAAGYADQLETGVTEYYSLILFALAGMMTAASANHLALLFVSLELITVSFYVLTSFQRRRLQSLEAGVKYLILGALASAFLVYGIALVFGASGTMSFTELARLSPALATRPLLVLGLLMVLAGLAFKIAAVPFQVWAPDVYQGAPAPTAAFLAIGSKAAGFVLLLRLFQTAVPEVVLHWEKWLMAVAALTILYGNLCAIPQRNLKRLLGYSSMANAGYLLMGVIVLTKAGSTAVLFYLGGYLFTLVAAFTVICVVLRQTEAEDLTALAGLGQRAPFLALVMTLAMTSLAGVPPLAGFFGKFLLIRAALEQGAANPAYYWLVGVAILGVVISFYYYFGVIRALYWPSETPDLSPVPVSWSNRLLLAASAAGMLFLGILPGYLVEIAEFAVKSL
jgi:NADH-quinone oxidoreductase subunit N